MCYIILVPVERSCYSFLLTEFVLLLDETFLTLTSLFFTQNELLCFLSPVLMAKRNVIVKTFGVMWMRLHLLAPHFLGSSQRWALTNSKKM